MTHETFRDLLPLYVIGALDAAELRNFEQYVAANRSRCEVEIAEFQTVANQLALTAAPAKPAPEVLNRIMAGIEPAKRQSRMPVTEPETAGLATVLRWMPWCVATALCVITLAALWLLNDQNETVRELRQTGAQLHDERASLRTQISELTAHIDEQARATQTQIDQLRAVNNQLTQERDDLRQKMERQDLKIASLEHNFEQQLNLMIDPAVHVGQLADPTKKSTATAKVFWEPVKNAGLIIVSNLPAIPKGGMKSLELWVICEDQKPVPAGLFWTDASGQGVGEIKMAKQVTCTPKFAVSIEPAAGVDLPTGSIVLLGQ